MRNKGIWGKGLSVGECEVARTYTYLLQIYYTNTMQNYHAKHTHLQIPLQIFFPSMRIYRASIYKPYPTYTYTFVALYTYLQVVPGCFFLI